MKYRSFQSKIIFWYRIFAITSCILLTISLILYFAGVRKYSSPFLIEPEKKAFEILSVVLNIISIVFFLIGILRPKDVEYLSAICYVHCIQILATEPSNLLGIILFTLGTAALAVRGRLNKKRTLKFSLLAVMYLAPLFSSVRLGRNVFFNGLLDNIVALALDLMIFLFVRSYVISIKGRFSHAYIDLTRYKDLSEIDMKIIRYLKSGNKYDWIAGQLDISTPTLKKKVKHIFTILNVPDLTGFHAEFSGKNLLYTQEEVQKWKNDFLQAEYDDTPFSIQSHTISKTDINT